MIVDLINKGIELNSDGFEENPQYNEWQSNCLSSLATLFGKHATEVQEFRRASSILGKITVLRTVRYALENGHKKTAPGTSSTVVTVNQLQSTSVHNEVALNIILNIDHSGLSEKEKEEVKVLYKEVSEEVQKQYTDWESVRTLLKRSFDYGLKIAPDIVKLADAYFRAKGGK